MRDLPQITHKCTGVICHDSTISGSYMLLMMRWSKQLLAKLITTATAGSC